MRPDALDEAIAEARRFLERASAVKQAWRAHGDLSTQNPKETGALRRSSMDLTRALADLRRSR